MKNNNISFGEAVNRHNRAIGMIKKEYPSAIPVVRLMGFIRIILPYGDVYLSARIIGELVENRNPSRLVMYVLITLFWNAFWGICLAILDRKNDIMITLLRYVQDKIIADKMMDMDYCHLDRQSTHDRVAQIKQNENWHSWGLYYTYWIEKDLSASIFGIAGVLVLTLSLFIQKIPSNSGKLTILNSPWMTALVIGIY